MSTPPAKAKAEQKFRDADSWQLAFDICAKRYQNWLLLWISRRSAYAECVRIRIADRHLRHLTKLIDEAHDFALVELDNMRAAARNASSAELAGRIYYEEHEENP
ncbi:MAG: hypothetical protein EPN91_03920 [Salinibacterium sp.]|nr:MAG: hypothetical protein EPN91_03920 [Salinibacterium sp.]